MHADFPDSVVFGFLFGTGFTVAQLIVNAVVRLLSGAR